MAMGEQAKLIEAAARAGVKWILPTEYAGDGLNEEMVEAVPLFHPKRAARRQIEELIKEHEGLRWIGVATNPWLEAVSFFSLFFDFYGSFGSSLLLLFSQKRRRRGRTMRVPPSRDSDIRNRKQPILRPTSLTKAATLQSIQRSLFALNHHSKTATIYPDAGPFNSTTLAQASLGITRLLSLPLTNPSNPRASLAHYANNFVYLSSFLVTQESVFNSLKRATGTEDGDWKVERGETIEQWAGRCREAMGRGDMRGGAGLTFAYYMGKGRGGDYEAKAREDREVLGLKEEDLDEAVRRAVRAGEPVALNFGK